MSSLSELIARVEKASGQDRELDGRIWCALSGLKFVMWDGAGCVYRGKDGIGHIARDHVKEWSASIDAALTLLPEGWEWELSWIYGRACAKLGDPVLSIDCDGSTPALALVAACLKARLLDAASSEARG